MYFNIAVFLLIALFPSFILKNFSTCTRKPGGIGGVIMLKSASSQIHQYGFRLGKHPLPVFFCTMKYKLL